MTTLRGILFTLFTMTGIAATFAGAVEDCNQGADLDRRVKGCTAIIMGEQKVVDLTVIYNNRGIAWSGKGDKDRAIADYDQAIKLNPNNANIYNNRGIAWSDKGEVGRAISDYDQAIRLDPKSAAAYDNRGNAWDAKGDRDRAIADYDQAIRLNPRNAKAYYNRAYTRLSKGENDRAIADFDQFISLNPNFAPAYNNRGTARLSAGDLERAITDFDEAIKMLPKESISYWNRGRAKFAQADFAAASGDFMQAAVLGHSYSMLWRFFTRARLNQDGAAELGIYNASLKSRDWPAPIIEFYLDKLPIDQLRAAADVPKKLCEMNFYVAEWHIARGELATAKPLLETAVAGCSKQSSAYGSAVMEMKLFNP